MGSGCALLELKLSGLLARVVPVSSRNPSEEIPMRLKTHKDSAGNLRPSGRRGCQFASASTEPKVIFLPLQNKRTCIAESPMLECSSTHSLRGCAPQCGYVQMQVLQNFCLTMLVKREIIFQFNCSIISLSLTIFAATKVVLHKNQSA